MARFKYRLQPLLNVKIQVEDSMKNELGKAIQRLEAEKGILASIETDMQKSMQDMNCQSANGIAVGQLKQLGAYIALLRDRKIIQKENINLASKTVDKCREELLKAAREREMFEKLKEKNFQEYLKEENRLEQKLNDEIVSYNYSRLGN